MKFARVSMPSLPLMGRVDSAKPSGVGAWGLLRKAGGDPDFPTPDFASLRLDPPHKGEGVDPPPCAPSVTARERAPPA